MLRDLTPEEREEIAKLKYIIEQRPGKLDALLLENRRLRLFVNAVRKYRRHQHAIIQHMLDELPRVDDARAWENLVANSREELPS